MRRSVYRHGRLPPLESLPASVLRSLLTQERTRRQELEQEVLRLRAGLARQNEVILRLEQRETGSCGSSSDS